MPMYTRPGARSSSGGRARRGDERVARERVRDPGAEPDPRPCRARPRRASSTARGRARASPRRRPGRSRAARRGAAPRRRRAARPGVTLKPKPTLMRSASSRTSARAHRVGVRLDARPPAEADGRLRDEHPEPVERLRPAASASRRNAVRGGEITTSAATPSPSGQTRAAAAPPRRPSRPSSPGRRRPRRRGPSSGSVSCAASQRPSAHSISSARAERPVDDRDPRGARERELGHDRPRGAARADHDRRRPARVDDVAQRARNPCRRCCRRRARRPPA